MAGAEPPFESSEAAAAPKQFQQRVRDGPWRWRCAGRMRQVQQYGAMALVKPE